VSSSGPQLLGVLVVGIGLLALAYAVIRSPELTLCLFLVLWVATTALRDSVDLSVTLGGVRVSALDVLSTLMIIVGIARLAGHGVRPAHALPLALLGLLVIHVLRGVEAFGFQAAVNGTRGWFYFTASLVYASTASWSRPRRGWLLLTATGVALAAVAVPYLVAGGLHPATRMIYRNGEWVTNRPVVATGALLILEAAILCAALNWPSRATAVPLAMGLGLVVLLLEHRTVWVAGAAVVVAGFASWSQRRVREAPAAVSGVTGVALLALPFVIWGFSRTSALVSSIREATTSHSTFAWRTTSWEELIASHHSVQEILTGQGSGASWDRLVQGQVAQQSPHNAFVDAYLRFGLPGVLVFSCLGLLLWYRRREIAAAAGVPSSTVTLLLVAQLVFCVAYNLDGPQGFIDGILVSSLAVVGAQMAAEARVERRSRSDPMVVTT
jgi:hypothetical protein